MILMYVKEKVKKFFNIRGKNECLIDINWVLTVSTTWGRRLLTEAACLVSCIILFYFIDAFHDNYVK